MSEDCPLDVARVGDSEENDASADVAEAADVLTDTIQLHLAGHILPLLKLVMVILDLLSPNIEDIIPLLPIFELVVSKRLLVIVLVRKRVRRAAFDGHEGVEGGHEAGHRLLDFGLGWLVVVSLLFLELAFHLFYLV